MAGPRVILHVDMDAFFAAIEQRDFPHLRGKPVLVGGSGKRGVVTTASYEARPYGCRSAMPMGQALRLCPHAIVVPGRYEAYSEASRQVREVLERFSPDIEPVSIDEAYVELTNVPMWSARAEEAAREMKRLIREKTRVTASVGISSSKFLAKIASDMNKPDGLMVLTRERAPEVLAPMSIGVLRGIGKVSQERFERAGVRTVGDLLVRDDVTLKALLGEQAVEFKRLARGEDERPVHTEHVNKSIGKEHTFGDDIADPVRLRAILMDEVEHAARSLRADGLICGRVALKLRRPDFTTYSRSGVLPEPTDKTGDLWPAAAALFDAFWKAQPGPLRLLGVRLEALGPAVQPGLFDQAAPERVRSTRVDAVTDAIAQKFGKQAIGRAGGMGGRSRRQTGNSTRSLRGR